MAFLGLQSLSAMSDEQPRPCLTGKEMRVMINSIGKNSWVDENWPIFMSKHASALASRINRDQSISNGQLQFLQKELQRKGRITCDPCVLAKIINHAATLEAQIEAEEWSALQGLFDDPIEVKTWAALQDIFNDSNFTAHDKRRYELYKLHVSFSLDDLSLSVSSELNDSCDQYSSSYSSSEDLFQSGLD